MAFCHYAYSLFYYLIYILGFLTTKKPRQPRLAWFLGLSWWPRSDSNTRPFGS